MRLLLFAMGICTFALAGLLIFLGWRSHNPTLLRYALYYIVAATVFLSLRALLIELKQRRKHKVRKQRESGPSMNTGEA
jgi:hypothetical protein